MSDGPILDAFLEVIEVSCNGAENRVELFTHPDVVLKIDGLSVRTAQTFGRLLYQRVRVRIEKVEDQG